MVEIINKIDKNVGCGIYLMKFSNGMFYIGCSRYVKERVSNHCTAIKSNFQKGTCPSLKTMQGFKGTVRFFLIKELVYTDRSDLMKVEAYYINKYRSNNRLINQPYTNKKKL